MKYFHHSLDGPVEVGRQSRAEVAPELTAKYCVLRRDRDGINVYRPSPNHAILKIE